MGEFMTKRLPGPATAVAPDGAAVRVLLQMPGGSMAHFELGPGVTARAVQHRTVDELWYVLAGRGEMWRRLGVQDEIVALAPGVCVTIPVGTLFQFRSLDPEPLRIVAVTMPPWPGDGEAVLVAGRWEPTV